ncbi:MAG TPA: hypothetical protein VNV25_10085 [Gemmatimonadaceae bacterium]|jgi:hypothetical protein|nr:hypothetical protein [Gemmatimonadaceae bacterium]
MAFDLKITFTGLCMFVIDKDNPVGPRLHVLLMECPHATHSPVLLYDKSYADPQPSPEWQYFLCAKLDNCSFDFPCDATTPPDFDSLPISADNNVAGIGDLDEFSGCGKLSRSYIDDSSQIAAARFTLRTGRTSGFGQGSPFTVETKGPTINRKLVHYTEWLIPNVNSTVLGREGLLLQCSYLTSQGDTPLILPLFAHNNQIRLVVMNAMAEDIPPNHPDTPMPGTPASHFGAYYECFDTSDTSKCHVTIPQLVEAQNDPSPYSQWTGGCDWVMRSRQAGETISSPICIHALVRVKSPGES